MWASAGDLQGQIDKTTSPPTGTTSQQIAAFQALHDLESRASKYAWSGNIMVAIGLAAGGIGAYFLWKDHDSHVDTIAPAPAATGEGATLVVGGHF